MLKYQFAFLDKFKKDYKGAKKKNPEIDDEFSGFLEAFNHLEGVRVSGTGGAQKIRLARKHQGKSGGYRIYYFFQFENKIYLLRLFAKNQQEELRTKEKIEISQIIKAIKDKAKP